MPERSRRPSWLGSSVSSRWADGRGRACPFRRRPSLARKGHKDEGSADERGTGQGGSKTMADVTDRSGGLSASEVAARKARGEVNAPPPPPGRTYRQIILANVFSFINN